MHPELTRQLAEQHITELRRQAAGERLIRELRGGRERSRHGRRGLWERLRIRQPRPTAA